MAFPILLAAALTTWLLILSVIVGLCQTARKGDLQQQLDPSPAFLVSDHRPGSDPGPDPSDDYETKIPVLAQRSAGKPTSLSHDPSVAA